MIQIIISGLGDEGQLGHGHTENVPTPTRVEALKGQNITHVYKAK